MFRRFGPELEEAQFPPLRHQGSTRGRSATAIQVMKSVSIEKMLITGARKKLADFYPAIDFLVSKEDMCAYE